MLLDGRPARSCLTLAVQADGREIETVESLANGAELHPLQQAFHENFGLQCGFCTPGILMTARFFLEQNPDPTEEEIRAELAGNLCRCTGYAPIVDSILARRYAAESALTDMFPWTHTFVGGSTGASSVPPPGGTVTRTL